MKNSLNFHFQKYQYFWSTPGERSFRGNELNGSLKIVVVWKCSTKPQSICCYYSRIPETRYLIKEVYSEWWFWMLGIWGHGTDICLAFRECLGLLPTRGEAGRAGKSENSQEKGIGLFTRTPPPQPKLLPLGPVSQHCPRKEWAWTVGTHSSSSRNIYCTV